ncbi:hypothetical protein HYW94_02375 [Candidatus Uhrbacteria bacterium]|nr:hypothetical protein [Candidatus Uhrbacteria bacterium]
MDPLIQEITNIIQSSLLKEEKKSQLYAFLEKTGVTEDFFELLKKLLIEEAKERKVLFLETLQEWNTTYAAALQELDVEEQKNDDIFAKQLSNIDPWDMDTKNRALQKYSNRQEILYETQQKKLIDIGIQCAQRALQKISSTQ